MPGTTPTGPHLEPTLPGTYYSDPVVLERELERIFYDSWLCAGREEHLPAPGDFITLVVGRESILLVRDKDGVPHAFFNVCRHRGSQLCSDGSGRMKGVIRCPYHSWIYGLDGRLIGTPGLHGDDALPAEHFSLRPVALQRWRGFLFVNLGAGRETLEQQFDDMPERARPYPLERLRAGRRTVHEVEANWKILVENYQECYHCPDVHPELCDIVPLYRSGVVDLPGRETAWFKKGAVSFTHGGTTRRPLFPELGDDDRRRFNGEMIMPNMFMNLLPDYVLTRTLWPLGPTRTRLISEWLFDPAVMEQPGFDGSDAYEFADLVARQDWAVCERVQRGVASRSYSGGVYLPVESAAADIKRWVLQRLERG